MFEPTIERRRLLERRGVLARTDLRSGELLARADLLWGVQKSARDLDGGFEHKRDEWRDGNWGLGNGWWVDRGCGQFERSEFKRLKRGEFGWLDRIDWRISLPTRRARWRRRPR
jgi:hypothetical protein